jgi:hypothetical protein
MLKNNLNFPNDKQSYNEVEWALWDATKSVLANNEVKLINKVHNCISYDHMYIIVKNVKEQVDKKLNKPEKIVESIDAFNCGEVHIKTILEALEILIRYIADNNENNGKYHIWFKNNIESKYGLNKPSNIIDTGVMTYNKHEKKITNDNLNQPLVRATNKKLIMRKNAVSEDVEKIVTSTSEPQLVQPQPAQVQSINVPLELKIGKIVDDKIKNAEEDISKKVKEEVKAEVKAEVKEVKSEVKAEVKAEVKEKINEGVQEAASHVDKLNDKLDDITLNNINLEVETEAALKNLDEVNKKADDAVQKANEITNKIDDTVQQVDENIKITQTKTEEIQEQLDNVELKAISTEVQVEQAAEKADETAVKVEQAAEKADETAVKVEQAADQVAEVESMKGGNNNFKLIINYL